MKISEVQQHYLDIAERLKLQRDRLGPLFAPYAAAQLAMAEQINEDLAALMGMKSCGKCPRTNLSRDRACRHVIVRRPDVDILRALRYEMLRHGYVARRYEPRSKALRGQLTLWSMAA